MKSKRFRFGTANSDINPFYKYFEELEGAVNLWKLSDRQIPWFQKLIIIQKKYRDKKGLIIGFKPDLNQTAQLVVELFTKSGTLRKNK